MNSILPMRRWSPSFKTLATVFLFTLAVAYGLSLVQVAVRTGTRPAETLRHYVGSEEEAPHLPQSFATMLSVAHVHTFSQPVVIGLTGLLFAFTGLKERQKILWILVSFLGSLSSNAGPWLVRYVSPGAVGVLYAGGSAMFLGFLVMAGRVLWELWFQREVRDV